MHQLLNPSKGVSVVLVSKKISLKTKDSVNTINMLNPNYKLSDNLSGKNFKTCLVHSAPKKHFKSTMNANIIPFTRMTHLGSRYYPYISSVLKQCWFHFKFRYFGKGLKIKKGTKNQLILFNLGSSHDSKLYFNTQNVEILRTKKNSYTVISYLAKNYLTKHEMWKIRPYNKYTRRGLRLSRQPVFRRFGKVSQIAPRKK